MPNLRFMVHHLQHISDLIDLCRQCGIRNVVISPGSRNAPLIQGFTALDEMTCHSIPDERVAGYFAMGIALETGTPVVVLCTSGTATLNLAPAVAEAFYQHVPLVVITADRPVELVDNQQNQTIPQQEIYSGFIKQSLNLSSSNIDEVSRVLSLSTEPHPGPVHINVPVREPLYEVLPPSSAGKATFRKEIKSDSKLPAEITDAVRSASKILILCGQQRPDEALSATLKKILQEKNAVVVAEAISNIDLPEVIANTEPVIASIKENERKEFLPDLLISTGGHVVSKRWMLWMQKHPELNHWRVSEAPDQVDTYGNLKGIISGTPASVIEQLMSHFDNSDQTYFNLWQRKNNQLQRNKTEYLEQAPFCELKVFELLLKNLPEDCNLHLGNGSVVRYAQMFDFKKSVRVYGNRGVSGIDGSFSTATGVSAANPEKMNILIIGDMSFIYDSNAMWNRNLPENIIIFVINNSGGGIFRLIDGPSQHEWFEPFQVAQHPVSIRNLSLAFGLEYYRRESEEEIRDEMPIMLKKGKPVVVEIVTPADINEKVFKQFYKI
ncbi:MAG: 2-succinyl-5-enolpyruvyl-6-hydroxy-3-cyclohexene-1-carboxylic-acid synthase [Marinilabiliales bacterium]|nr:MAG: 2-succinyl-5-enolpyruvyl-6-hydroxy-3-cyclohexene-1-carboxylic-acid synthase [Marinilabiliales bacterium]